MSASEQAQSEGARAATRAKEARAAAAVQTGATWEEACDAVLAALDLDTKPDLALAFIDSRFAADYAAVLERLRAGTGARRLAGASGMGVIGPGHEAEDQPAISLLALSLPGATITTVAIGSNDDASAALDRIEAASAQAWLLFADPFTTDAESLVGAIGERKPGATVLGGLASAQPMQRDSAVFLDGEVRESGAVLVGIGGAFGIHTIVAQGAEPIGQPWTVTECEGNVVRSVGSRPALEVLQETLAALDPATRERAQRNLLVGLAIDEYRHQHARGDFLIRNILGGDRESGAIAINATPRVGQTLQFQFRDAEAADLDLREHLRVLRVRLAPGEQVLGALLCSCNGRGQGLFGEPHHDAQALEQALGPTPTAGMFCSGEIGPVGGKTFVHGFTASIALLTLRGSEKR